MEINMVGVKLCEDSRVHFCAIDEALETKGVSLPIKGERVIVDSDGFLEVGIVTSKPEQKVFDELSPMLKKIVRVATDADEAKLKALEAKAKECTAKIKKVAAKYSADMKVINCMYSLDESKLFVAYTSENRVDFREIVKELASLFRTRIEMRQIGDRDEARKVGGLGPCGKVCCCKQFLGEFAPVSIKMAKNQNLSLNPAKISGICGRLFCCLSYENAHYAETQSLMPKIGSTVTLPEGKGTVVYNDLLKRRVSVRVQSEQEGISSLKEFDLSEVKFNKTENSGSACKHAK